MSLFHLRAPHMKHEENSIRGIRKAARARDWRGRRKYTEIDLDMLITKDNRIVGCHWPRPMVRDGFKDPEGQLAKGRTVASMTLAEVSRLRARTGLFTYRIQTIERLLAECAKRNIGAVLEPKGDPRFDEPWPWEHIAKVADDLGVHVRVYALRANKNALPAARAAGFHATELNK